VRQRDLAGTIRRIQKSGASDFYTGETARRIVADMAANQGFLSANDLASYRAIETKPLSTTYRGHPLLTVPPSSSGGMTVVEALNVLEHFSMPLGREGSSQSWHYIVEALRRAARDRLYHAGDPSFDKVPSARLTSKEYAAELARTVLADRATPQPQFPQVAAASPSLIDESTSTTHFSVLDGEGNMVANTYTLGSFYGAQVVVRGTGVLLGDMVATLATGVPVGGRDPIRGGRRMASTMSPVLLLRPHSERLEPPRSRALWFR
jgi:gamma-glutamyltranspeptidase/glutathione hydrolase